MSTLAKNTFYLTFASIAQKVIAFVYFAQIARYFDVEGTGPYFLSLAMVTVIMVFDDLGLTSVLIREVAKERDQAVLWSRTVIGIKLITMPLTVIAAFVVPGLLGYSDQIVQLVRIAVVIMLADTLSLSFYGILRGMQNLRYEAIGVFIGQMATATIGFILMATGHATLPLLILALATGSVWNVAFSAHFIRVKLGWKAFVPTWRLGMKPLKIAFAFFLAAAFVKVYSYVDSFILGRVIGDDAVGIYAVAYKLTYAFQFLPLAFIGALYPTMSAQAGDPEKLRKTLLDAFWYMALLAGPIVLGIFSIAPELIDAFYGPSFADAVVPLMILIFVLIPIFLDFPIGSLLNATDRQMTKTIIGGFTMLINVVANVVLIPMYGVSGAAIAGLISFTFLFVIDWVFAKDSVRISVMDIGKTTGRIFASAVVMALVVMLIKPYVHFTLAVPVGAIVYVACLIASGAVNRSHWDHVKRLLFKKVVYAEDSVANG